MVNSYDNITITSPEGSAREKGKQMWACLDALATHYENVDMTRISLTSRFSDDRWDLPFDGNRNSFLWSKWLPAPEYYPLLLVCKVVAYHEINTLNKKAATAKPNILSFISVFKDLFASKRILTATRNQPFQNLSYLESTDVLHVAQIGFAKNGTINRQPFDGLNSLASCPLSTFPNAAFLTSGSLSSLPWSGRSLGVWSKEINVSLLKECGKTREEIVDATQVKSYPPLKMGVMEALIQNLMPFFEEHFELIENVFDEIELGKELGDKYRPIHVSTRTKIERKFGEELNNIFPLEYSGIEGKNAISQSWFSDFENHIQGAVAWLILLTTGLRNSDMRNLVKDCCQPSKRFDLLNYLITNIKKTDLTNYIIPVPPVVAKAIKLAALAKRDRCGYILLTKRSATAGEGLDTDKRRMNDGRTFNKLLKEFAAHYNIRLDTISDDDDDATAHCIRATLAGYIGANSHAAIIILKRLFGHSNNLMPDAYLANNPLIIKQRQKSIADAQEEQATIMASNVMRGKVTGVKGKQLLDGAKHIEKELRQELSLKNESLTEMDFHVRLAVRLKEVILMRIAGSDIYALKTPVGVICMRSQSDSTDSPCSKLSNHQIRKELNISKDVTDALATLPNPSQCVGKECSDSLLGEDWSRDLLYSFDYSLKLLKGQGHKNIDIMNQAKHFLNNYGPLLKDIYSDEREEKYFD